MRLGGKRAGSAPERMDIAEQIRTDPEGGSRRLVAELGAGLYALALRLCGNRADAEDLYVRTLETAVAKIAEQRGPFFSAWLRAICLNLRRGDVVTQYTETIAAVMLPTVNYTTGNMVMERIRQMFFEKNPGVNIPFHYRLAELGSTDRTF